MELRNKLSQAIALVKAIKSNSKNSFVRLWGPEGENAYDAVLLEDYEDFEGEQIPGSDLLELVDVLYSLLISIESTEIEVYPVIEGGQYQGLYSSHKWVKADVIDFDLKDDESLRTSGRTVAEWKAFLQHRIADMENPLYTSNLLT